MRSFITSLMLPVQSTLVISKGLSEILRDIRTSTYQICRIEETNKQINRTTTFHKLICNLTSEVRDILKHCGKDEKLPLAQFLFFFTIFCNLLLDLHVKNRDHIFTSR